MKLLKGFKSASNSALTSYIQIFSTALFVSAMFTGMSIIMMLVLSAKNEGKSIYLSATIFFLLISLLLNYLIAKVLSPEIRNRLNCDK